MTETKKTWIQELFQKDRKRESSQFDELKEKLQRKEPKRSRRSTQETDGEEESSLGFVETSNSKQKAQKLLEHLRLVREGTELAIEEGQPILERFEALKLAEEQLVNKYVQSQFLDQNGLGELGAWLLSSLKMKRGSDCNLIKHTLLLLLKLPVEALHLEKALQIKSFVTAVSLRSQNCKEEVRLLADQLLNQWYRFENLDAVQMTYDRDGNYQKEYSKFQQLVQGLAKTDALSEQEKVELAKKRVRTSAKGHVWAQQFPHKFVLRPEEQYVESMEPPVNWVKEELDQKFNQLQKKQKQFVNVVSQEEMRDIMKKRPTFTARH